MLASRALRVEKLAPTVGAYARDIRAAKALSTNGVPSIRVHDNILLSGSVSMLIASRALLRASKGIEKHE